MRGRHLFISGIPGCGKSSFGRWLEDRKGYAHIDMEHDGLDRYGFRSAWESFYSNQDPTGFLALLEKNDRPLALDWGFPPGQFPVVQRIKDIGVKLIWFDGDRLSARNLFKGGNSISVEQFDKQFAAISEYWGRIEDIFGNNIIKVIQSDGTLFSENTIYTQIFGEFP